MNEKLRPRTSGLLIAGLAIAMLIPCFWQPRIQAGDLASHVYNAWLAGQIQRGAVAGLIVAHPMTNVLADWALQALQPSLGPAWAERLVAAIAVQVFFWGAFWLISLIQGRQPWIVMPFLAMLSYGLIFHLGFLNFYLGLGLTFCLMSLLWRPSRHRVVLAIPVAILALLAHAFPLVWGVLALAYVAVAARLNQQLRVLLLPAASSVLILIQTALTILFPNRWYLGQIVTLERVLGMTGAQQFWLYGVKYLVIVAGILVIWAVLFLERLDKRGMLTDPIVHLWCLNVAGFLLLPYAILLPGYRFTFQYIPERISLLVAFLFCAMVGGGRYGRGLTRLSAFLATAFFTFVYMDGKGMNAMQARIAALLDGLPAGQRVVIVVQDSGSRRLNGLVHVADGVCVRRCFDYADYEPSTGQFRLRVLVPNGVVAPTMETVSEIELGEHIVTREEAPLYSICPSPDLARPFLLRRLAAGEKTCVTTLPVTPQFF